MKPKQSIRHVGLSTLRAHDNNRDLSHERVEEMADSMREHGVLLPLVVTEHPTDLDCWLILDGHHRAAAARMAGLPTVPVVVRHDLDDTDEQLVVMLVANCQRQELSAIDRAEVLGQLRDRQGLTLAEVARRTGLSAGRISESLALLDLDQETRTRVRTGEVGVGTATRAVRQARKVQRTARAFGRPQAKPTDAVAVEGPHFGKQHPLAERVQKLCVHTDVRTGRVRPTVGGIACGQCWEQVIRTDELNRTATGERK
ncbi:ParB/RepB/Spo0J family partition protein [Kribbella sp. NPDC051718]|uniref:ParB/RepB/Spo0J family partition protein n=1 Tax=Kribbella sp. NPDC051718 TaxID=3155168 RepID=UPI00342F1C1C